MKVTKAEIFSLDLTLSEEHRRMQGAWHPIVLRLHTDEGLTGLGEVGLAYGVGHKGGVGMLQNILEAYVIGADPRDREVIWNDMQRLSFWGGAAGPVINAAMSAVDIALWDITGKALDQPIWRLLGGKVNRKLRTYASQIQFGWSDDGAMWVHHGKVEDYAEAARVAIAQGYTAVKVDPIMITEDGQIESPHRLKGALDHAILHRTESRIAAIREAVGPEVDIILELHSLTSITGGQQLAQICAPYNMFMVEEAVNYNSARNAKTLKHRCPEVRMAGGERIFTRWQYRSYLEDGSLDMLQPDFCLVGGISEGRKIADMAHAYEVTIQGHVCGSPISGAAALHIEASIPNFQIHEHHITSTNPANRSVCVQDYQPVNGDFEAPDLPGLGLDLDEDFVKRHATIVTV